MIDIQKAPDTQTVIEGQKATFTITVTNTGNVPLTDVTVTDALSSDCDKVIGALDVSGSTSYTCQSPAITADMTNVAVVSAKYGTTQIGDDDSANVVVDYLPNIEVTKSADPTSQIIPVEKRTIVAVTRNTIELRQRENIYLSVAAGFISHAAHGKNNLWIFWICFHFCPKTLDVNIYKTGICSWTISPHLT